MYTGGEMLNLPVETEVDGGPGILASGPLRK